MELFRLFGSVLIEDKEAIESLKSVDNQGKNTNKKLSEIVATGAKIGAAVVAGTGVAITGLMSLASNVGSTAKEIDKFSKITGFSTESFQEWDYIMGTLGYSMEQASGDMAALAEKAMDAAAGVGEGAELFNKLGVSVTDASGSLKSQEQIFESVILALQSMTNETERNAIASALMSTTGEELTPLLSMNAQEIENMKNKAAELGLVMSQDSVNSGVAFQDNMMAVKGTFEGIKNEIVGGLLPGLTNILNWFLENSPQIQSVAGAALGFISDTIGFITENSNILIPVLAGLLGAFLALQAINTINALMTAWKTSTVAATLAQGGLNAVMMANPIALVIAAIAALIAIGTALVMNWDKVKEAAGKVGSWISEKWEGIKTKTTEIWNGVKDTVSNVMNTAKDTVKEKLNNMKAAYEENGGGIRGVVAATMEGIKGYYTAGFDFIDNLTGGKLSNIVNSFRDGFDRAKEVVGNAIDKIKGFLDFKWEFPKLKLPRFSVSGSMNPLKWIDEGVPKISVDWYAKGGIFSKPTIFNTPYGLKGVGDAKSPEVVAPLSNLNAILKDVIADAIAPLYLNNSSQPQITVEVPVKLDGDVLFRSVQKSSQEYYNRSRRSPFPM